MTQEIKIAIIAALSAILGALISQVTTFLISYFDKEHQKKLFQRQKYEEMAMLFFDSLGWMSKVVSCTNEKDLRELSHNFEARKALSLCQLYFPEELANSANNYLCAQQSYYAEIFRCYDESDKQILTAGGQASTKNPKVKEAKDHLFTEKVIFENLIVSNAQKYTIT